MQCDETIIINKVSCQTVVAKTKQQVVSQTITGSIHEEKEVKFRFPRLQTAALFFKHKKKEKR